MLAVNNRLSLGCRHQDGFASRCELSLQEAEGVLSAWCSPRAMPWHLVGDGGSLRGAGRPDQMQLSKVSDSSSQNPAFHLPESLFTRSSASKLLKQSGAKSTDTRRRKAGTALWRLREMHHFGCWPHLRSAWHLTKFGHKAPLCCPHKSN